MSDDELKSTIIKIFQNQLRTSDELTEDVKLQDLDLDSLDMVEIIMTIEMELKITVDVDTPNTISTISDVINLVRAQLTAKE